MDRTGRDRRGSGDPSGSPPATSLNTRRASTSGSALPPADALNALARELYWAGAPSARSATDAGSVRERLQGLAHRLRIDAVELYPPSEVNLDRVPGLRRSLKRRLWHVGRFATARYDRIIAELADLNVQLAERVTDLEREVERLRDDREDGG